MNQSFYSDKGDKQFSLSHADFFEPRRRPVSGFIRQPSPTPPHSDDDVKT